MLKNGSNAYYWRYNANGMPAIHTDYLSNRVYYYTYDSLGRLVRCNTSTKGTTVDRFISQYRYDSSNNVTKIINISDGTRSAVNYNYDDANRPSSVDFGSVDIAYVYDSLGRLYTNTLNTTTPVTVTYTYNLSKRNEDSASTYRTTEIGWETIGGRTYEYTYDKVGNITKIREKVNGVYSVRASYTYDSLGQLIRENNLDLNKTIEYTYDNGGNLKSKTEYAYTTATKPSSPTKTITYTYDSAWKDKLTSYDGESIAYDSIGNPTTYRGATLTWSGRNLMSYTKGSLNVSYTYGADGLRTSKTVNGVTTEYYYRDGQLVGEKLGNTDLIWYRYDADGRLALVLRKILSTGGLYYYYPVLNTRGDIIELYGGPGALTARYTYDSWGKLISVVDGSGATIGAGRFAHYVSLRYRGYYYDAETELYYLQSRYFDPEVGRFLNADDVEYIGYSGGQLSYNAFAYCENNAVNNSDPSGKSVTVALLVGVFALIGGAAGYGLSRILKVPKEKRWKYILGGAIIGGIVGGCVGYAIGASAAGSSGIVLWSGGGVKGAGAHAAKFAAKNGLRTLEMTKKGKFLSSLNNAAMKVLGKQKGYKFMKPFWNAASKQFVKSAAGKQTYINVFISANSFSEASVFAQIEYKVLRSLGMKIIWHFVK